MILIYFINQALYFIVINKSRGIRKKSCFLVRMKQCKVNI